MRICVFCSSSEKIDGAYRDAARDLGKQMARGGHELVFGGGRIGLMGAVARSAHAAGGRATGIIPGFMHERGVAADEHCTEMIITEDMRERKARMEALAEAFLILPGGFGTCEEVLEILTLKQLRRHNKAVVFLNTRGYFDKLLGFFEHMYEEHFAGEALRETYKVVAEPAEAIAYLESYVAGTVPDKFASLTPPA